MQQCEQVLRRSISRMAFCVDPLSFPIFIEFVAFNAPEAAHVQYRLPRASVSMPPPVIRPIKVAHRVAIVGVYGENQASSQELIEYCRAQGIDVVVRPHAADNSGYWTEWEGASGVHVDRGGTFDEFLERHCPCVMATWHSTTVYDALVRGIVPVSFAASQPDIAFPLADMALSWPEQKERVQVVLSDAKARYDALAKALLDAIGPSHGRYAMQRLGEFDCNFVHCSMFG